MDGLTKNWAIANHVVVIRKEDSWPMRAMAWLMNRAPDIKHADGTRERRGDRFMRVYVTTYRLPFQDRPTIAVPDRYDWMSPGLEWLRCHEMVHADDLRSAWDLLKMALLLTLFPLPIYFSGRWYIERDAMVIDIRAGVKTPEKVAEMLWDDYLMAWPKQRVTDYYEKLLK